jgi:hypothetical protein
MGSPRNPCMGKLLKSINISTDKISIETIYMIDSRKFKTGLFKNRFLKQLPRTFKPTKSLS